MKPTNQRCSFITNQVMMFESTSAEDTKRDSGTSASRRASLSTVTPSTRSRHASQDTKDAKMARRSSLSDVPQAQGSFLNNKPKPRILRRSSLCDRLSKFENVIAENAKHNQECKSFLTNVVSTPVKPLRKKIVFYDDVTTPTTVTSEFSQIVGMEKSLYSVPFHSTESVPSSIYVHLEDSSVGNDSIDDAKTYVMAKDTENDVNVDSTISVVEISPSDKDIEGQCDLHNVSEPNKIEESVLDDSSDEHSILDESVTDLSVSELYDTTRFLVDWDYQMSALQYRLSRGRKTKIDTGSRINVKERMKTFVGK